MFAEYIEATTVHGFSYIHQRHHVCQRFFWILVISFLFIIAGVFIHNAFEDWNENPVMTTLDSIAAPIGDIAFPTVTICQDEYTEPDVWAYAETLMNSLEFSCRREELWTYDYPLPLCNDTTKIRQDFEFVTKRMLKKAKNLIFQGKQLNEEQFMFAGLWQYTSIIFQMIQNQSLTINDLSKLPLHYFGTDATFVGIMDALGIQNPELVEEKCSAQVCNVIANYLKLIMFTSQTELPLAFGRFIANFAALEPGGKTFDQDKFLQQFNLCDFDEEALKLNQILTDWSRSLFGINMSLFEIPAMLARPRPKLVDNPLTYAQAFLHTRCSINPFINRIEPCGCHENPNNSLVCKETDCNFSKKLQGNLDIMQIMRLANRRGQSELDLKSLKFVGANLQYMAKEMDEKSSKIKDRNALLPWCRTGLDWSYEKDWLSCDLFQPVVTDLGICQAYNALPTLDFLHQSKFTDAFQNAFESDMGPSTKNLTFGQGAGPEHELVFYIYANNLLRRTPYPTKAFYMSLTPASEYFMQGDRIAVDIGMDSRYRIEPMEIIPTKGLKNIKVDKRHCHFTTESKGKLKRFKKYSQAACKLECNIVAAEKHCNCLPWYFPNDPTNDSLMICDLYGNLCFDQFFKKFGNQVEAQCQCWPDCHTSRYSITEKNFPLDPDQLCHDKKSIPYGLASRIAFYSLSNLFYKFYKISNDDFNFASMDDDSRIIEICYQLVKNDLARVSVTFASKDYIRTIKDTRVTLIGQLGVFGGTLGLFTGMSILSIIEMTFWIFKFFMNLLKALASRKQKNEP